MKQGLFLMISLSLWSCGSPKTPSVDRLPEVVVIFDHAPQHEYYTFSDGTYGRTSNEGVSYIDTMLGITNFVPSTDRVDTIVLPTFDGLAEMYYTYWAMERINYLFKAGDTIRFEYLDRDYPYARCVNNPSRNKLYNKIDVAKGWRMANGFSDEAILTSFPMEMVANKPDFRDKFWPGFIPPIDSLIRSYKQSRAAIQKHLDSIGLTDKSYYERTLYIQSLTDQRADLIISMFLDSTKAGIDQQTATLTDIDDPIGTRQGQLDDNRLHSLTYQNQVLNNLSYQIAKRYSPVINHTNYGGGGGGAFFDHSVTFDTILLSKKIPRGSKNVMLKRLFDDFQFFFTSVDQEIAYRRKYDLVSGDTTMRPLIKELEASLALTDDLYLKDPRGRMVGLSEVLARHKGKVIYVDYWGSSCPPCIRAMPDAAALRAEFEDKDVVFLYLSYDKHEQVWKDAIRSNNIEGENFMMVNSRVAPIVKELSIYEYPRYMIYDRHGKLVEQRASGPSFDQAKVQLLKYLNN